MVKFIITALLGGTLAFLGFGIDTHQYWILGAMFLVYGFVCANEARKDVLG